MFESLNLVPHAQTQFVHCAVPCVGAALKVRCRWLSPADAKYRRQSTVEIERRPQFSHPPPIMSHASIFVLLNGAVAERTTASSHRACHWASHEVESETATQSMICTYAFLPRHMIPSIACPGFPLVKNPNMHADSCTGRNVKLAVCFEWLSVRQNTTVQVNFQTIVTKGPSPSGDKRWELLEFCRNFFEASVHSRLIMLTRNVPTNPTMKNTY